MNATEMSPPLVRSGHGTSVLAEREQVRDAYRADRDPIADARLLWRAQTVRHLTHLMPGDTILELGSGDMRFTRQLARVTRGENPITAATFRPQQPPAPPLERVETVTLEELPGALAGRKFDVVVALDMLDARDCAVVLANVHDLLAPSGQLVFVESNPWNPWLRLRRIFRATDRRGLLPRRRLYELLSEMGFIRVFAVYTDFVYPPLSRRVIWLLRNLSIILENTRGVSRFAGCIVLYAQKPPRALLRPARPLCDHDELTGSVSVVVPCRNEEDNVGRLIERLLALYGDYIHEIIPVDDSSSDATAAVLRRYAETEPQVKPIYRQPPNGVGRALSDGYIAATGEWVLSMDCDFLHLLPEIRDMFDAAAAGAPVVIGSRFSRHSVLLNYPLGKIVANRVFHVLAHLVVGQKFRDVTNNLKMFRRPVLDRMRITAPHFSANAETGLQPILMGFPVAEVPISWINRSFDMGQSSFRLVKVGGGYFRVLLDVGRARLFGTGPYASLCASRRTSPSDQDARLASPDDHRGNP